jgi:heptosyltransferase II
MKESDVEHKMGSKRALIIKMGAIGDVITVVPAARQLHEQGFEVHWVCGNGVRGLLKCYPWIHQIPVNEVAILTGSTLQRIRHILGLWTRIPWMNWELCATLYFDARYRLLTLPVRARRKVALSNKSRETNLVTVRSYSDEYARILLGSPDGCRPDSLEPLRPECVPPSPLPPRKKVRRIAIVPGGTSNLIAQQTLRRWPIEHYVTVAELLTKRDWEVVLLGGPEDLWVRPFFEDVETIDCIAKASLPEVLGVCDSCDVVITHDTGPMHLAGLSTAAIVAIFGPTNPGHVLPHRRGVVALWGGQQYACRPCYDLRSYAPCQSAGCIQEVTPADVIQQMDRLLEQRSSGKAEPWQVIVPSPTR